MLCMKCKRMVNRQVIATENVLVKSPNDLVEFRKGQALDLALDYVVS